MYTNLFHEDMTHGEARKVLFASVKEDMSEEELDHIKADYFAIIPAIIERELKSYDLATLTSDPI